MRCEKCGEKISEDYFIQYCFKYFIYELNDIGYSSIVENEEAPYQIYLCKYCWYRFKDWLSTELKSIHSHTREQIN